MIDPHHVCWWTTTKRTELRLFAGGTHLSTAGVSARVLLSALAEPNLVWCSTVYGDFDDNVDILAVHGPLTAEWPQEAYAQGGPVAKYIGDLFPVTEYVLNDAIADQLGLMYSLDEVSGARMSREGDPPGLPNSAAFLLSSHDDCFSHVFPLNYEMVSRIMDQVLHLHSFYLGQDFEWGHIGVELTNLLTSRSALRLQSKTGWLQYRPTVDVSLPTAAWNPSQQQGNLTPLHFRKAISIWFDGNIAIMP